ncbi:MAG TPA: hypothetical protein VNK41_11980 [Vicinamibacterales bacterium]|nr:hypothetical protein [Vicinamibacterales bacterium]
MDRSAQREAHDRALDEARRFHSSLASSKAVVFSGVAAGEDVRVSAPGLAGAALVAEGVAIHVTAFAIE